MHDQYTKTPSKLFNKILPISSTWEKKTNNIHIHIPLDNPNPEKKLQKHNTEEDSESESEEDLQHISKLYINLKNIQWIPVRRTWCKLMIIIVIHNLINPKESTSAEKMIADSLSFENKEKGKRSANLIFFSARELI